MAVRAHGTVYRVPEQKPGAIACCAFCPWSRFFPKSKRKRGTAVQRANRALNAHVDAKHRVPPWVPGESDSDAHA